MKCYFRILIWTVLLELIFMIYVFFPVILLFHVTSWHWCCHRPQQLQQLTGLVDQCGVLLGIKVKSLALAANALIQSHSVFLIIEIIRFYFNIEHWAPYFKRISPAQLLKSTVLLFIWVSVKMCERPIMV